MSPDELIQHTIDNLPPNPELAQRVADFAGSYQRDSDGAMLQVAINTQCPHLTDEQKSDVYARVQDAESYAPIIIERALNRQ